MARKAQMFIIAAIFLVGLIFSVQQLLFQYTALDISAPLRDNDIYLLKNTKNIINQTIKTTPECEDFSKKMEELNDFLNTRIPLRGYVLSIKYRLNCTYWANTYPNNAPLNLTIQITGKGSETSSTVYMYNK
jgi:hypothetical protein